MSLLRYFIIDSLTFGGSISPNSNNQQQISKIYWLLIIQFCMYYVGSVLLFYFILENWFWSALIAVLFTFIYFSISMVLLSGLRRSNYLKVNLKKHTNKKVIVGSTIIDANEISYEETTNKNELIPAVLLRAFFIIVFGFFIFIGLILGISLYTKPNLDDEHRKEILNEYEAKNGKDTEIRINLMSNKLWLLNENRKKLESNYKAAIDSLQQAKDLTHRMIFATDTAYFQKAIANWDFVNQNEANKIVQSIKTLQDDFDKGFKKLDIITAHKKFGIHRINEFRNGNSFLFWLLFLFTASLFVLPYFIRFKMVLTNSPLDISLEDKIVSKIKKDYRMTLNEMDVYHKKYGVVAIENEVIYEDAPFAKRKQDNGELIALKNQMNLFLNNEI